VNLTRGNRVFETSNDCQPRSVTLVALRPARAAILLMMKQAPISNCIFSATALVLTIAASVSAGAAFAADSPDAFRKELAAIQPPKLVWREIDWIYCLLDGIAKARAAKKPILLWAFINSDPAEERC
jgi:hypothetical protein